MAAGHRVDDDEVVVLLAHLPRQLADGEDLLHAGRGVGDEVEGPGERADAGEERQLELEAEVLLQRLLGVHRHRPEVGLQLTGLEAGVAGLVEVGQVALGVDLADEGALALLGRQHAEPGRDGRLADATLAGDEDELAVEQIDHRGQAGQPGQLPNPMR